MAILQLAGEHRELRRQFGADPSKAMMGPWV